MRRSRRKAPAPVQSPARQYATNEQIRAPHVRLIDEQGVQLGVTPTAKALTMARERELDLIEIAPNAEPPVARILDFGKFVYQMEKEMQKRKANQKKIEIKGVRLSLRIGKADRDMRLNQAKGFLNDGHKLKIELVVRGREHQHIDLAREILENFLNDLNRELPLVIEQPLVKMGNAMSTIVFVKK